MQTSPRAIVNAASMLVLASTLGGCEAINRGLLGAAGPVAEHERHFFLIVAGILLFVAGPVLILTPIFAWHYRLSNTTNAYRPKWGFSWALEGFIWIPPIGIVILLAVLLWPATHEDDPYTRLTGRGPPVRVQAVGLDWKWLFIYPDEGIATVNRLAVPAGRPVAMQLTSGTVMQSMLLPQLAGQIYAMAGMSTKLNFATDKPGTYLGENTQYNGENFSKQKFDVVALTAADYQAWLEQTRIEAKPLDEDAWQALAQRGVLDQPLTYSGVPARFYDEIVTRTGRRSHAHTRMAADP